MGRHRENPDDYLVRPQHESDDEPRVPEGCTVAVVIGFGLLVVGGLTVLCMMWLDLI